MRIHFTTGSSRPTPRVGDRRTTKKHGVQVRVLDQMQSGPHKGAYRASRGKICMVWVTLAEAYERIGCRHLLTKPEQDAAELRAQTMRAARFGDPGAEPKVFSGLGPA